MPAARQDDWTRLTEDGGLQKTLEDYFASRFAGPPYTTISYVPLGATSTFSGLGAVVYCNLRVAHWAIRHATLSEDPLSPGPVRVHLGRLGSWWCVVGMDVLPDDIPDPPPAWISTWFPVWAQKRADSYDYSRLEQENTRLVVAWASSRMPPDRLVPQPPLTVPDPHHHVPALAAVRMLNPKYWGLSITPIGKMRQSMVDTNDSQVWASRDGRFHLRQGADMYANELLLDDAATGMAFKVRGPGQIPWQEGNTTVPDPPAFVGHTLVIDMCTDVLGSPLNVVHYEIACDTQSVIRAVPCGPLAINPAH